MARFTISELLNSLKTELAERYEIDPAIRYFRVGDVAELSNDPVYYLEPGTLSLNRRNVASAEMVQTVRFLVEYRVQYATAAAACAETIAFFERVGRDLMKAPNIADGAAFLQGFSTFTDAPGGVSVQALQDGVAAIFGGIELTFSVD